MMSDYYIELSECSLSLVCFSSSYLQQSKIYSHKPSGDFPSNNDGQDPLVTSDMGYIHLTFFQLRSCFYIKILRIKCGDGQMVTSLDPFLKGHGLETSFRH